MAFEYASRASQGARSYQEDAAIVRTGGAGQGSEALTAVLADGMGGHAGGALASSTACQVFLDSYMGSAGEVPARLDDVRHHLVGAPLTRRRRLGEARRRHGGGRRPELSHCLLHLTDDLIRRELGALSGQVAADAQHLCAGHSRDSSTSFCARLSWCHLLPVGLSPGSCRFEPNSESNYSSELFGGEARRVIAYR